MSKGMSGSQMSLSNLNNSFKVLEQADNESQRSGRSQSQASKMAQSQRKEIQQLREKEKKRSSKTQANSPVPDPYELNLPQQVNNKVLKQPLKPMNLKIVTKLEVDHD